MVIIDSLHKFPSLLNFFFIIFFLTLNASFSRTGNYLIAGAASILDQLSVFISALRICVVLLPADLTSWLKNGLSFPVDLRYAFSFYCYGLCSCLQLPLCALQSNHIHGSPALITCLLVIC